jgi:hypothetical protein
MSDRPGMGEDGLQMTVCCAPVLTYAMYAPLRCSQTNIFDSS